MRANYDQYLNEIIRNYLESDLHNGGIRIVRCYDAIDADKNSITELISAYELDAVVLFHEFKTNEIQKPFEPFLEWIREAGFSADNSGLHQIYDETNVYVPHRELLTSYLATGECKRTEKPIISEIEYETVRMTDSLIRMINFIFRKKPVIMILNNLNYAEKSTIDILLRFIENKNNNISILASYNEANVIHEYKKQSWDLFIEKIEKNNFLVVGDMDDEQEISVKHKRIEKKYQFKGENDLKKIVNLVNMLAIGEAEYYIRKLFHMTGKRQVTDTDILIEIHSIYSYVSMCNNNTKNAFLMCKKMSEIKGFSKNQKAKFTCHYLLALIHANDSQRERSYGHVAQCLKIAEKENSKEMLFEAKLLKYMTWHGIWKDVFEWDKEIELDETFLKECEERKQYNHLAYLYFFTNFSSNIMHAEDRDKSFKCYESEYFKKGMKYAEMLDNDRCIFKLWQKIIIYSTSNGRYENLEYYYQRCLKICYKNNDKHEEAEIYNGIAYDFLVLGRYEKADEYLKKSLKIMLELKNTNVLLETLYNISLNALLIKDYETVIYYVNHFLKIMKLLGIERIRICNITKIYGILAIAYIKLGRVYDAKVYIKKMQMVLRHLLDTDIEPDYEYWEDDIFLYQMIIGMIYKNEKNYSVSEKTFEKGIELWKTFNNKQNYIFINYIMEYADLYNKLYNENKKSEIVELGMSFCDENNYEYQKVLLERYTRLNDIDEISEYGSIERIDERTMDEIMNLMYMKGIETELQEKNKALLFLETWVEHINKEDDTFEEVVENVMSTMQNAYDLDRILWYRDEGEGKYTIIFADEYLKLNDRQLGEISEYFKAKKEPVVLNRNENEFDKNDTLLKIFGFHEISSIIGIPVASSEETIDILIVSRNKIANFIGNITMLDQDDAGIILAAFQQIIDAGKREVLRMELEKNSVTDLLTGILNRQGMKQYIGTEINELKKFTVLYMDLDNFKFCNDNFGHNVGDEVLKCFAYMLKDIIDDSGKIIRYGGDEFIAIIPEKDEQYGEIIAKKIFKKLEENKGFYNDIIRAYGREITISKEHRISCSVGISFGTCSVPEDIDKILKRADAALYDVKNSGKNSYIINV